MPRKTIEDGQRETQAISSLLSLTSSGATDDTVSEYALALDDIDTGWIVAACDKLRREWTGYRSPRPGDIRAEAMRFRRDSAQARKKSNIHTHDPCLNRKGLEDLASDMRAAFDHGAMLSGEDLDNKREEWLDHDVATGRISRRAANNLRASRES